MFFITGIMLFFSLPFIEEPQIDSSLISKQVTSQDWFAYTELIEARKQYAENVNVLLYSGFILVAIGTVGSLIKLK